MVATRSCPPTDAIRQPVITAATSVASLPPFCFVDCCVAATAASFAANDPSCFSCPAGCCVTSHHDKASHPLAPLPLVTPLPLAASLLCHSLSGWLLHCLSSCRCLPPTGVSTACHANASSCAPLVPLVLLVVAFIVVVSTFCQFIASVCLNSHLSPVSIPSSSLIPPSSTSSSSIIKLLGKQKKEYNTCTRVAEGSNAGHTIVVDGAMSCPLSDTVPLRGHGVDGEVIGCPVKMVLYEKFARGS